LRRSSKDPLTPKNTRVRANQLAEKRAFANDDMYAGIYDGFMAGARYVLKQIESGKATVTLRKESTL